MSNFIKELSSKPLTNLTWPDFENLFGKKGACGGCWCMTWRLTSGEYEKMKGAENKQAMEKLVAEGDPVGIMAYVNRQVVGWCSVSPREHFPRLKKSRILAKIDALSVWSVVCFFVDKQFRNQEISKFLIREAVKYAVSHGASVIEAYPVEPKKNNVPPLFVFTGLASAFADCDFMEVARRSDTRLVMRWIKRS